MSGLLLVGHSEARLAPEMGGGAAVMRTLRFRGALEDAGHRVDALAPPPGPRGALEVRERLAGGGYDAVVAVSMVPALAAVGSGTGLPLWIDVNGAHIAEMQLKSALTPTREILARTIEAQSRLLMRGDRFSAVSGPQRHALEGQLLLLGRLDGSGTGEEMVSVIGHCATAVPPERRGDDGGGLVVLSSGSFNLWFDGETLFGAMELLMERHPDARFVSVGGAVPHSPESYGRFAEMVSGSSHADRMELLGWVDGDRLERAYGSADVAVYADLPCIETELGARTRVLDWVSRGIPVVCTEGAEVSLDVREHGLGITVPQRSPEELAGALMELADAGARAAVTEAQRRWCEGPGSPGRMFRPLLDWAEAPRRSVFDPGGVGRPPVGGPRSIRFLAWLTGEHLRRVGLRGLAARVARKLRGG